MTLACGGITTPSSNVTDTFSGSLAVKGINPHTFNVSNTGEYTVKLTNWGPNSNLLVGIELTVRENDGSCTSIIQQNLFAVLNIQALNGAIVSGKYCVAIFDVGTMTAAQNYTMTVSHPQ